MGCDFASGSLYGNVIPRKSSQKYRTPLVISQQVEAPPSSAGLPGWLYKWSLTLRWGARLWDIFRSIALRGDWWVYQSLTANLVIPSGISRRSASGFTGSFAVSAGIGGHQKLRPRGKSKWPSWWIPWKPKLQPGFEAMTTTASIR